MIIIKIILLIILIISGIIFIIMGNAFIKNHWNYILKDFLIFLFGIHNYCTFTLYRNSIYTIPI